MGNLTPKDLECIASLNWKVFTLEQAIEIAEAWNAGVSCRDIAPRYGVGTQSIAMAIGPMRNAGVALRPAIAGFVAPQVLQTDERPGPLRQRLLSPDQIARARKLAPFDEVARRALGYATGASLTPTEPLAGRAG